MELAKKPVITDVEFPDGTRSDLDDPDATVPVETLDLDDEDLDEEDDLDVE